MVGRMMRINLTGALNAVAEIAGDLPERDPSLGPSRADGVAQRVAGASGMPARVAAELNPVLTLFTDSPL